jgi:hypothetical protein
MEAEEPKASFGRQGLRVHPDGRHKDYGDNSRNKEFATHSCLLSGRQRDIFGKFCQLIFSP